MQPPCQGKQRRDQTITRTSPQSPAVCISRGEHSQPVWTARRQAPQHLCPAPRCCPQPVRGLPQGGPRCHHPLARTELPLGASRCGTGPLGTEQSLHPLGSSLQPASPHATCEGSPPRWGCCHQRCSSAYIFIFLIAACHAARAQLDSCFPRERLRAPKRCLA